MRGIWSAEPFSFRGSVYSVHEADVEPKPEQPIPIWLGTHGRRGLEMTGRLADGWIPSAGSLPPDRVPEALATITRAAVAADRDLASLTRIYNVEVSLDETHRGGPGIISGDPTAVGEAFSEVLRLGFNGLNLIVRGRDRRGQIERIATEIIPNVQSAAERAR
jgi:alkanesulfonate monooxygenase SsuD/methylene tetrahydromethanopterin reductase-like flavin-dependent oxidoreductase (luciferase family)